MKYPLLLAAFATFVGIANMAMRGRQTLPQSRRRSA